MKASGFGLSHVGRVRERNEDSVYVDGEGRFALLTDGMGGHLGGQEASNMTIEHLKTSMENLHEKGFPKSDDDAREAIREAFRSAAIAVANRGQTFAELENLGTTLVLWTHAHGFVHVAHAGDSRAYLLKNGELFQATMDHLLCNEQVRLGMLKEQANRIPLRHVLVRNIGVSPASVPDIVRFDAHMDDVWMLCSDGLTNKLLHSDLQHLIQKHAGRWAEAARILVEEAWHRGGEDNISVILLNFERDEKI
jgi:PPM family protein phosphatase